MNRKDEQLEHIARAFYVAREASAWESAPRILKHEFRLYARQAIDMLEKQHEKARQDRAAGEPARPLETA